MTEPHVPELDDLPYDPHYEGHADWLEGIQKVRAFRDEAMRRAVYDIWSSLLRKQWAKPTQPSAPKKDWTQTPDRTCVDTQRQLPMKEKNG